MATNVLSSNFNVKNAQRLLRSIQNDNTEHYFVTIGHHVPWQNDSAPPSLSDDVATLYDAFDNLIAAKKVEPQDATLMAPYIPWVSNTIYQPYSDQIDTDNQPVYVVTQEGSNYNVFLCLNNNGGAPSTGQPLLSETSDHDPYYVKQVDGYQWKYLYTIPADVYNKFATSQFVPCTPNGNVALNAANGAIETIILGSNGVFYNSYANGFFTAVAVGGNTLLHSVSGVLNPNPNFYVNNAIYIVSGTGAGQLRNITSYSIVANTRTIGIDQAFTTEPDLTSIFEISPQVLIVGDGTGAQARALVNAVASNSVYQVQMISGGSGYSYANVTINGVTFANSSNVVAANTANGYATISPFGGHGFNVPEEIGASYVGVSVTFANTENGTIPATGQYRQFGLIQNPLFANVVLTYHNYTNANNLTVLFSSGETVVGSTSNAQGTVVGSLNGSIMLSNVTKAFIANETISGQTSGSSATVTNVTGPTYTVDCRTRLTIGNLSGSFQNNEVVYQGNTYGTVHFANSSFVALTEVKGSFVAGQYITGNTSAATANVTIIQPSDLVRYRGDFVYLENIQPVTRANTQSETLRIVFSL